MRPVVMKAYKKALLSTLAAVVTAPALASSSGCCSTVGTCNCENGHTYWTQREQDAQQWLYMALSADKQHKSYAYDKWYNSVAVKAGYEHTFDGKRISSYFFGKDGCLKIGPDNLGSNPATFVPDKASDEGKFNVRSSDLGLPAKLEGCATLNPRISNVYVDFDWYAEWNQWVKGLNTWVNIPFIHTKWSTHLCTKITNPDPGIASLPGMYYVPYNVKTYMGNDINNTIGQTAFVVSASQLEPVPVIFTEKDAIAQALLGDKGFGDAPALTVGKIKNCARTTNGLAGIRFGAGYDFITKERGNMGVGIDVVAPAANKPAKNLCCCNNNTSSCCGSSTSNCCDNNFYYFMPSIGGQHAWKVGGVLRGQYIVWNKTDTHNITMYLDGRAYGILKAKSTRLLGLYASGTDKFNHWLILKKYDVSSANAAYLGLERAANLLKAFVENKTGLEGQATIMFTYKKDGFAGDLGYNFFGRRAECIKYWKLCNKDATNSAYKYVIRAEAPVRTSLAETPADFTQQGGFFAKKTACINTVPSSPYNQIPYAVAARGSQAAWAATGSHDVTAAAFDFGDGRTSDIRTSVAQHPAYYAHTIFGSLGYTWVNCKHLPSLGVIGKVEIGHKNTSMRSWGFFVEGGLTF